MLRRAVASLRRSRSEQKLEKTAFHDLHMSLKGKVSLRPALRLNLSDEQNSVVDCLQMVPFAGYELPVLYETEWGGIIKGRVEFLNSARFLSCLGDSKVMPGVGESTMVTLASCRCCCRACPHQDQGKHLRRLAHGPNQVSPHITCQNWHDGLSGSRAP